MTKIFDHTTEAYKAKLAGCAGKYNGALYYSREIVENIIPLVETDRNWITVNVKGYGCDHSIMFVHNNLSPENYDWLRQYKDIVLVCGVPETCEKVAHLGKTIYLPLSVDVDYVKQFKLPKEERHGAAFAGRRVKAKYGTLPDGIDYICGVTREVMLQEMAKHEYIYAVGRCAIEAKILGCKLKAYDNRYPSTKLWKVLDNKEAAKILQKELDQIDG